MKMNRFSMDLNLLLFSVETQAGRECREIVSKYLSNYKISEICKELNLSRFKVQRRLDKGLKILKQIIQKERNCEQNS